MAFRFEQLEIWHDANGYAHLIYDITKKFPRAESFSLVDQLRRAGNSVPTNTAEGSGSSSNRDFINYLNIAIKSVYETVSLAFRAEQEGFVNDSVRMRLYDTAEILIKRIQGFKKSLK